MISYINELYKKEVEDNKELRDWVDKWNKKKREIVEEICIKKEV